MNSLPRAALSAPIVRIQTRMAFPDGRLPRVTWADDGMPLPIVGIAPNVIYGIGTAFMRDTGIELNRQMRIHPDDRELLEALCPVRGSWSAYTAFKGGGS